MCDKAAPEKEPYSKFHAFINHGEKAQRAYLSLSDLPESYQHEFLRTLDENPSANVEDLASFIRTNVTVHGLSVNAESESESSKSSVEEGQLTEDDPQQELAARVSREELDKMDKRVMALEAQVRELGVRADNWEKSAQTAAEDAQQRSVALKEELDQLRRERDMLKLSEARKYMAWRRELAVNLATALIFFLATAVVILFAQ
jgi:hypothetical protein